MVSKEEIIKILNAGVRAPSGDNMQPWSFIVEGNHISIIDDVSKDSSIYNPNEIASMFAHGALIENIVLAAGALGKRATVSILPEVGNTKHSADIVIEDGTGITDETMFDLISRRTTNRNDYLDTMLTEDQRKRILGIGSLFSEGKILLVEDEVHKKIFAKLLGVSERILLSNRPLHDGLMSNIRWTSEEVETSKNGLSIHALGLSLADQIIMRFFLQFWKINSLLGYLGIHRVVEYKSYKKYLASSAIGAIVMNGRDAKDFINAGRIMERMWIEVTDLGLSLQPMFGLLALHEVVAYGDVNVFPVKQRHVIIDTFKKIRSILKVNENEMVMILFRVGTSNDEVPVSLRRPPTILFKENTT